MKVPLAPSLAPPAAWALGSSRPSLVPPCRPQRAYCGQCSERIWGLARLGYRCVNCKLLVHKRCHVLVPLTCQRHMVSVGLPVPTPSLPSSPTPLCPHPGPCHEGPERTGRLWAQRVAPSSSRGQDPSCQALRAPSALGKSGALCGSGLDVGVSCGLADPVVGAVEVNPVLPGKSGLARLVPSPSGAAGRAHSWLLAPCGRERRPWGWRRSLVSVLLAHRDTGFPHRLALGSLRCGCQNPQRGTLPGAPGSGGSLFLPGPFGHA